MISIIDIIGDFKEDVLDDIKKIFVEKDIISNENNIDNINVEYDDIQPLDKNEYEKKNKDKLTSIELNLINGDIFLNDKINDRKDKKKKNLKEHINNILDELEFNEEY